MSSTICWIKAAWPSWLDNCGARTARSINASKRNVPTSGGGAELLFDVISSAYERTSILITTNPPFER